MGALSCLHGLWIRTWAWVRSKCKERWNFNTLYRPVVCCIFETSYWIHTSLCVTFITKKKGFLALAKQKGFSRGEMVRSRLRGLPVKCYINDKILKELVWGEQSFSFLFHAIFAEVFFFPYSGEHFFTLLLLFFITNFNHRVSFNLGESEPFIFEVPLCLGMKSFSSSQKTF